MRWADCEGCGAPWEPSAQCKWCLRHRVGVPKDFSSLEARIAAQQAAMSMQDEVAKAEYRTNQLRLSLGLAAFNAPNLSPTGRCAFGWTDPRSLYDQPKREDPALLKNLYPTDWSWL